jgi:hypothetical protein
MVFLWFELLATVGEAKVAVDFGASNSEDKSRLNRANEFEIDSAYITTHNDSSYQQMKY